MTDPWHYAAKAGRNYITPEDITDAIAAGAERVHLYETVLRAINDRAAEDYRLCAFVSYNTPWPDEKT